MPWGSFKRFEASPRKRAITEQFCCGNMLTLLIKPEKLIQIFNFCVGESHAKVKLFITNNKVPTLKHRGDLMMFWGCLNSRGTKQLIGIRRIKKSENYIKILDENIQLSVQYLDVGWQFTFQQDNDSKHMSKSMTAWLQKKKRLLFCHGLQ